MATFLYLFGFLGGGFLWVLYGKDILDFGYYRNLAFGGMIVCFVVEVVISGALKMKVYALTNFLVRSWKILRARAFNSCSMKGVF